MDLDSTVWFGIEPTIWAKKLQFPIARKRKRIYLEDSRYFVEEVRKNVINNYGFDKVYKQGFNIKTPINLKIQSNATTALREGLIKYDKRTGWRGPLLNKQ